MGVESMDGNLTLRAYRDASEGAGSDDDVMTFVASTAGVKRDGLEIDQDAWSLANYEANPVVLWAHQYDQPPIGKATVRVEDDRLLADVTWDSEDDLARSVARKYRDGFMSAVSVGWSDHEDEDRNITHELLDISAVPVPGDPDALAERQRSALADMAREILGETESPELEKLAAGEVAELRWAETAAGMVDALTPRSDESEDDRRVRYDALLPDYRHAERTPPEWLSDVELALIGVGSDLWRGLFLEGEVDEPEPPETRVGAVLSGRNKGDLTEAQRLIQRVLDAATKAEPKEDDSDDEDDERSALSDMARIIGV